MEAGQNTNKAKQTRKNKTKTTTKPMNDWVMKELKTNLWQVIQLLIAIPVSSCNSPVIRQAGCSAGFVERM